MQEIQINIISKWPAQIWPIRVPHMTLFREVFEYRKQTLINETRKFYTFLTEHVFDSDMLGY